MRRVLSLLAVAVLTATSAGCTCCPCLRNICPCNICGNLFAPRAPVCPPAAPVCAAPAPVCAPAPVYAAQPAAQQYMPQQYTVPQYAEPQFAAAPPVPVFNEAACGSPCPAPCPAPCPTPCAAPCATSMPMYVEMGCGMPYTVGDPGCGYMDSGYIEQPGQMMVDPGPQ